MPKNLKIAFVIDDSLDRPDGVQQHVLTVGKWLSRRGHQVDYLTSTTQRQDLQGVYSLAQNLRLRFNGNRLGIPMLAKKKRLLKVLGQQNYDIIHIQMPYSPLLAGRIIKFNRSAKVIGTFHILPWSKLTRQGAKLLGRFQEKQLTRFSKIISVSEPAQGFARWALGVDSEVIANPFEIEKFSAARIGPRSDAPTPNDPVRIVFLGRLVERKGARALILAAARLRELSGLPVSVVIAGRGPQLGDLQKLAVRLGMQETVSFSGFVAEEDKAGLLAGADIVALPSSAGESFGISVVEALAATRGVVIAGDNPGYRTVMAGFEENLIDPYDTEAFAQLLHRHVRDQVQRAVYSRRQLKAAARFDISEIGPQIEQVYYRSLGQA